MTAPKNVAGLSSLVDQSGKFVGQPTPKPGNGTVTSNQSQEEEDEYDINLGGAMNQDYKQVKDKDMSD